LRTKCLSLLALLLFVPISSQAQQSAAPTAPEIKGLGKATAKLDGAWQFHTGDNSAWSDPTFDDSAWESIQVDKPWGMQRHFNYTGYAWYRRHVNIDPATDPALGLALYIPHIDDVYELNPAYSPFASGRVFRSPLTPASLAVC
jgi:hypothetical protein